MNPAVGTFGTFPAQRGASALAERLIRAIVRGADAAQGVREACRTYALGRPCAVLAVGKAAPAMLAGLPPSAIERGLMVARDEDLAGFTLPRGVRAIASDHPSPTLRCVDAAQEVESWLGALPPGLPLVVLLSGGSSSLLTSPASGLAFEALREVTDALLRAGAPIGELNTVRKHLERLKGGRLATLVPGREVRVLVLSDVIGDHLDQIASGPLWPDPTTYADALAIVVARAPQCLDARAHLVRGVQGDFLETPKPGAWTPPPHHIVRSNADAVAAACDEARRAGFRVVRAPLPIIGEAAEAARAFIESFRHHAASGSGPIAFIGGGETTVRVGAAQGKGGRNQEFALAAAIELADTPGFIAMSVGTDGADGPTDAAGAIAWPGVLAAARAEGIDPRAMLRDHNSHGFFARVGGLVPGAMTRGSNVCDVMVAARLA